MIPFHNQTYKTELWDEVKMTSIKLFTSDNKLVHATFIKEDKGHYPDIVEWNGRHFKLANNSAVENGVFYEYYTETELYKVN